MDHVNWYLQKSRTPFVGKMRIGDRVKLHFMSDIDILSPIDAETDKSLPWQFGGEYMWVVIIDYNPLNGFIGKLKSKPATIQAHLGDYVSFSAIDVIEHRATTGWATIPWRVLETLNSILP